MGDKLDKAFSDYDNSIKDLNKNEDLIEDYTNLMTSIIDEKIPSSDLKPTIEKACKIEKEKMDLYPTVYTEPSSVCD